MRLDVSTGEATELIDVTDRVQEAIQHDLESGVVTIYVPHTTAGVIVNEAEGRLLDDIEAFLDALVPTGRDYRHDAIDDNAAAHLRATVIGESVTVPVEEGSLALGTWQSILFVECDGPRSRCLSVTSIGS